MHVCVYIYMYTHMYFLSLSAPPSLALSFFLQYSEKALYNQLCFYKFIFDWDHAVSKALQLEEKSKSRVPVRLGVTRRDFICRITCANCLTDSFLVLAVHFDTVVVWGGWGHIFNFPLLPSVFLKNKHPREN